MVTFFVALALLFIGYHTYGRLAESLFGPDGRPTPAAVKADGVVYDISTSLLGIAGGALAVIGVVACPITSGDTAFRSARLTLADWFGMDQGVIKKRLLLTVPLLFVGACLTQLDFDVIWRYFSWANQTLAMIALWAAASYLQKNTGTRACWLAAAPAAFMSAVSSAYILMADEGFRLPAQIAYPAGTGFAVLCSVIFMRSIFKKQR